MTLLKIIIYVIITIEIKTIQRKVKIMSKIGIFALGGLDENGKNMYVVEVDDKLFILDAGLKYPTAEMLGIDEIIPDFLMLVPAKKRIKGIFISHPHEDHIGALPELLRVLEVPVYATNLAAEIIINNLEENEIDVSKLEINSIKENDVITFDDVKVSFFQTTHSIPHSIGIAIETVDGVIVYTSEYTLNQSVNPQYQTDYKRISELANKNVLALLIESGGVLNVPEPSANEILTHKLNNVFLTATGRIIFTLFSSDLLKIQKIVDLALHHKKKIAIIGRKAQRIVDIALDNGYLNIPKDALVNLRFIDEKNKNDDSDLVCLVTGSRHEPFYMLQRIVKKTDRLINIDEDDTVVLLTSPVPGTEKMAARTLDILHRSEAEIITLERKYLSTSHANADEVKMMINLLRPKYIIPVIGEYRHQYTTKKLALSLGYSDNNVILLDNGDVLRIEKGRYYVSKGDIKTGDILIDGTPMIDNNDVIMRDRALLAEDGAVLVIANVNPKDKTIVGEIEILTKGFIFSSDTTEVIDNLKLLFVDLSERFLNAKYINWNDYKRFTRGEMSKFLYKTMKKRPIVLPVIISTEI